MCYAFEALGPSGLIAALVFGRAVRVDASDDAGKAVWLSQGVFAWSPARRVISLVSLGKGASEGVKKRGLAAPFLLPIQSQLDSGNTGPADHEAFCGAGKGKA